MRQAWRRASLVLVAVLLAACAGQGGGDAPRSYDFGVDAPTAALPELRLGSVRALAPFDSQEMHYRLAYRDPAELLAFTQSRWAAPPADLMRRQFGRAAVAGGRCTLDVELYEVSQVFAARESSDALLEARLNLRDGDRRVAERTLRVSEPGAGGTAAAGAAAFARAANRAIAETAAWVAREPGCRAH
jgi:cholesterol transport system auxiliary component